LLLIAVIALGGVYAQPRPVLPPRDNTIPECFNKVADIFFVLDSSSSIYIEEYKQELNFVSQAITRFDVSSEDTRIGALTFSDDFQVGFDIDRFRTKGDLLGSIDQQTLPYRTGVTNTDLAISYVRQNQLFREDITKVIVVITDGGSRSPGETKRQADLAREAGFHMVVVGVGTYLDEQEWRSIASDPDNDYVYNITNFNALETLRDVLPRRICQMPPIIVGGECSVQADSDLFFVAAPNGKNDALDVMDKLSEATRANGRLQVRYIVDGCRNATDSFFDGPEQFCERFGDNVVEDENTYVSLLQQLRVAAERMRELRLSNQVVILFLDDLSMRNNRFGILQEARTRAQREGMKIIAVDLGVRDYSNFVAGMAATREDVINYVGQATSRSVRQLLDRICVATNQELNPFGTVRPSK